jgi:hypothetical protein
VSVEPAAAAATEEPAPEAEEAAEAVIEATGEDADEAPNPNEPADKEEAEPEAPMSEEAKDPSMPAVSAPEETPAEEAPAETLEVTATEEDEEMKAEEVKEEVKSELDALKTEPVALKTEAADAPGATIAAFVVNEKVFALLADDGEWYPGTISKVTHESGRAEYSVKWEECDKDAGEEEETDGFTATELKPRGADDFPVPSLKRSADTDGEPAAKRPAVGESS